MAFLQAMNSTTTKLGVNGANVLTEEGVGNRFLTLFTMLNRNMDSSYLEEQIRLLSTQYSISQLCDLFVMAFHTRDIRNGKGEKKLFYQFLTYLYTVDPTVVNNLIPLVPEYGCWRDMWELLTLEPQLQDSIFSFVKQTFQDDFAYYSSQMFPKMSLLSKWLPREKSNTYKSFAKKLAQLLFPTCQSSKLQLTMYRKTVSKMNKALQTVEINMCNKSWSDIKPKAVPGRCLHIHKNAFLNNKKSSNHSSSLRYPDDDDRMKCRENFLEHIELVKKGHSNFKGANVLLPNEIVQKLYLKLSKEELDIIQSQWDSVRDEIGKSGKLGKCVPMCDFSGSMHGTPHQVSLALGILISELNHPAFKDHILSFSESPYWHSFLSCSTIYEKVHSVSRVGQGLNTNFYAAFRSILDKMISHRVPVGEEPDDLIVLTDMGFDYASRSNNTSDLLVNKILVSMGSQPVTPWETITTQISREFKEEGEKLWGIGNGWKVPRIVIWNLRAEYNDFHATSNQQGVVQLSGWSPNALKLLIKHGINVQSPYQSMRLTLDDERYEPVRVVWHQTHN
jgi:hypothetical protein